LRIWRNW